VDEEEIEMRERKMEELRAAWSRASICRRRQQSVPHSGQSVPHSGARRF
jgi:hypothetical protein